MKTSHLSVLALSGVLALGGVGVGVVQATDGDDAGAPAELELRKDDTRAELTAVPDDAPDPGDGDDTAGDDGTGGGANTGDGDATAGDDGTNGGNNTFTPSGAAEDTRGDVSMTAGASDAGAAPQAAAPADAPAADASADGTDG